MRLLLLLNMVTSIQARWEELEIICFIICSSSCHQRDTDGVEEEQEAG